MRATRTLPVQARDRVSASPVAVWSPYCGAWLAAQQLQLAWLLQIQQAVIDGQHEYWDRVACRIPGACWID